MADDTQDLLAQAKAIQAQKLGQNQPSNDLLAQAQAIQSQKVQPKSSPEPWSKLQSFGQGALQGSTAGFSDELGGLEGAAFEKGANALGQGPDTGQSFMDLYKQYRDLQRGRNQSAQSANPVSFGEGEVTGGLAPAVATGGGVPAAVGLGAATGLGSSQQDLTTGSPEALTGALKDTGIGAGLGLAGGLIGKGVSKALTPEALDLAGSKMAAKAINIKPSKELTSLYNEETGKMIQGSDIIKGTGKTAMEEGALPLTGGPEAVYDNTLDAISKNQQKLQPLMEQAQPKLSANLNNIMENVGPVTPKTADVVQKLFDDVSDNSLKPQLTSKLSDVYDRYAQKLSAADGNLPALNSIKTELQNAAKDLSKNTFVQGSDASWESTLLKRMSGVVRQHIEDLANAADPGTGDSISQTNKTLGDLYTYLPYTKKLMDKSSLIPGLKDVGLGTAAFLAGGPVTAALATTGKIGTELATGYPINTLAKVATARGLNAAGKAVQTPIGEIAQKTITAAPVAGIISPWSESKLQSTPKEQKSTKVASTLLNATDDSLKDVANAMEKRPDLATIGQQLNKGVDEDNAWAKKQAIFQILQKNQGRKLVTPQG